MVLCGDVRRQVYIKNKGTFSNPYSTPYLIIGIKSLVVGLVINVVVVIVGVLWAFRIFQIYYREFIWCKILCALSELVVALMGGMASSMDEPMDVEVMCFEIIYSVLLDVWWSHCVFNVSDLI